MSTTVSLPLLDRVRTASPCSVGWDQMSGDERTRLCAECNLDVHNISQMTRVEAEEFLASKFNNLGEPHEHRVCALIYRRADGTIITADCPVGIAALRTKARRALGRIAAVAGLTALVGAVAAAVENSRGTPWAPTPPFAALAKLVGRTVHCRVPVAGGIILLPSSTPPTQPATRGGQ